MEWGKGRQYNKLLIDAIDMTMFTSSTAWKMFWKTLAFSGFERCVTLCGTQFWVGRKKPPWTKNKENGDDESSSGGVDDEEVRLRCDFPSPKKQNPQKLYYNAPHLYRLLYQNWTPSYRGPRVKLKSCVGRSTSSARDLWSRGWVSNGWPLNSEWLVISVC